MQNQFDMALCRLTLTRGQRNQLVHELDLIHYGDGIGEHLANWYADRATVEEAFRIFDVIGVEEHGDAERYEVDVNPAIVGPVLRASLTDYRSDGLEIWPEALPLTEAILGQMPEVVR